MLCYLTICSGFTDLYPRCKEMMMSRSKKQHINVVRKEKKKLDSDVFLESSMLIFAYLLMFMSQGNFGRIRQYERCSASYVCSFFCSLLNYDGLIAIEFINSFYQIVTFWVNCHIFCLFLNSCKVTGLLCCALGFFHVGRLALICGLNRYLHSSAQHNHQIFS